MKISFWEQSCINTPTFEWDELVFLLIVEKHMQYKKLRLKKNRIYLILKYRLLVILCRPDRNITIFTIYMLIKDMHDVCPVHSISLQTEQCVRNIYETDDDWHDGYDGYERGITGRMKVIGEVRAIDFQLVLAMARNLSSATVRKIDPKGAKSA